MTQPYLEYRVKWQPPSGKYLLTGHDLIVMILPIIWSKLPSFGDHFPWTSIPVTTTLVYLSSPPFEPFHPSWIDKSEKDYDQAKSKTAIKRGAKSHGIFRPPSTGSSSDDIVEKVADQRPNREIETGGRRNPAQTSKKNRKVDLSDYTFPAISSINPENDGPKSANWKTPY